MTIVPFFPYNTPFIRRSFPMRLQPQTEHSFRPFIWLRKDIKARKDTK